MSPALHIALLILLPFLGGVATWLSGRKWPSVVLIALGGAVASLLFVQPHFTLQWQWLPGLTFGWWADPTAKILVALVYFVSLLVHLFSLYYMQEETGVGRYFFKLGFFTTSMLGLLLADHLLLVFVFWELVGFSSYLLIGYWFHSSEKAKAAREAFMINRVADAGLLLGVILMITSAGQSLLSDLQPVSSSWLTTLAGFGLMIGALGKSAQFPFFGWLPKAMAGPTPISALIHAATMVAAGVYLLVRVYPVLDPVVLEATAWAGAITAFMAAYAAFSQFDIKKVLAYSTISQLGYMVMGIGVGAAESSLFHLWTHAFFKAGLFLAAGAIIHHLHHAHHLSDDEAQDMRLMGGLRKALPVTHVAFLLCGLALAGLPFFSGFLSKEGVLSEAWFWAASGHPGRLLLPALGFAAAALTPFYIGRQYLLMFPGFPRKGEPQKGHEPLWTVKIPLLALALGTVWLAHAASPLDAHGWWLAAYVFPIRENGHAAWWIVVLSVSLAVGGLWLAWKRYHGVQGNIFAEPTGFWKQLSFEGWYLHHWYAWVGKTWLSFTGKVKQVDERVIDPAINGFAMAHVVFAKVLAIFDREVVDGLVNLMAVISRFFGKMFSRLQSPYIQSQIGWMIALLIVLILLLQLI